MAKGNPPPYSLSDISSGQFSQSGIIGALTDGIEFPFSAVLGNLTENHGCHTGIIFTQIVFAHFRIVGRIDKTDKRIFNQAEMLSSLRAPDRSLPQ